MKTLLKRLFKLLGYRIEKTNVYRDDAYHLSLSMRHLDIGFVIDAGANRGQFSENLLNAGFAGKIISIEPLTEAWKELANKAKKYDQWTVYDRAALGAASGISTINVSNNLDSSSILPMTESHLKAAPWSKYVSSERCPVVALDQIFNEIGAEAQGNSLLKIDCQGYEGEILKGAKASLSKLSAVLTEVSLKELYLGQALWLDIVDLMERSGFRIYSVLKGFTDPESGETLQLDILFVNCSRHASGDKFSAPTKN